ncbi:hypothetical protein J9332_41830, partial [Aquimarina celericrescens]|nr:hypothetical protein [Aquimarina celericrescens]
MSKISTTEVYLHNHYKVVSIKKEHRDMMEKYLNFDYNKPKQSNLNILFSNLIKTDKFKIIKKGNIVSFGLNLVFKDKETFMSL